MRWRNTLLAATAAVVLAVPLNAAAQRVDPKEALLFFRMAGGLTQLHEAVLAADEAGVVSLLKRGADPNARSGGGNTALHAAAWFGLQPIVHLLIDAGAQVDARGRDGATPLMFAAVHAQLPVAELLIARGAALGATDDQGRTPLHWAAMQGAAPLVTLLLQRGAAIDPRTRAGETPLLLASLSAHPGAADAVRQLLAAQADAGAADNEGQSPYLVARDPAIRDALKAAGAKLAPTLQSVRWAVRNDRTDLLRELIGAGAPMNTLDASGRAALHYAIPYGGAQKVQSVTLLLNAGADPNLASQSGDTPLDLAISADQPPLVQLLIERGANVNAVNARGDTPLHRVARAAGRNDALIARLLVDHGAALDVRNLVGRTPLDEAIGRPNTIVERLLVERGAKRGS
jgi:uncharacterized protein